MVNDAAVMHYVTLFLQ